MTTTWPGQDQETAQDLLIAHLCPPGFRDL